MAQPYLDHLKGLLSRLELDGGDLACKHFFSGAALYLRGGICASLTPGGLALKLPEERCIEIIKQGQAIPLRYFDKSPIKKGYILLPAFQSLSDSDISPFFEECLAFASSGSQ